MVSHWRSSPPIRETTSVVDAPPVVMVLVPPDPVVEFVDPSPAVAHAAPAPVDPLDVPVPPVTHETLAPVAEDTAPAPVVTKNAQGIIAFFSARPAVPCTAPAPVETSAASSSVDECRHTEQRGAPVPLPDASASSCSLFACRKKKGEEGQTQEVMRMLTPRPPRPPSYSRRCPPRAWRSRVSFACTLLLLSFATSWSI